MFVKQLGRLGVKLDETRERRIEKLKRSRKSPTTSREQAEQVFARQSADKTIRDNELRTKLTRVFHANGLEKRKEQYQAFAKALKGLTNQNNKVMSYCTFGSFMAATHKARNGLQPAFASALERYLDSEAEAEVEAGASHVTQAMAAANDQDHQDSKPAAV
jgi:hypothetical protein